MATKFIYVHEDHQGLEINNAVVNVFDTLALATAKATDLVANGADLTGQQIVVLENPLSKNGSTFYRQYEWDGTVYRIINDTVGSDEIIIDLADAPITTYTGGGDAGIIAGVAPTLPQGVKLVTWEDANGTIHQYQVTDAGLGTQAIKEIGAPEYIYEFASATNDIPGTTLGLRPNTIYVNTETLGRSMVDASGAFLELEDGIFDFEFSQKDVVIPVGTTTLDINDFANITRRSPASLDNVAVEALDDETLTLAVEALDTNNLNAKTTSGLQITPNATSPRSKFDVTVEVGGTFTFGGHFMVKKS